MTSGGNLNPANADLGGWMGRMRRKSFMPTAPSMSGLGTSPKATRPGRAQCNSADYRHPQRRRGRRREPGPVRRSTGRAIVAVLWMNATFYPSSHTAPAVASFQGTHGSRRRTGRRDLMQEETFDIVVVGGGHNGSTIAAYLAKSGLSVAVCEARPECGGGQENTEPRPGFRTDPHATYLYGGAAPGFDELELWKYGMRMVYYPSMSGVVTLDGIAANLGSRWRPDIGEEAADPASLLGEVAASGLLADVRAPPAPQVRSDAVERDDARHRRVVDHPHPVLPQLGLVEARGRAAVEVGGVRVDAEPGTRLGVLLATAAFRARLTYRDREARLGEIGRDRRAVVATADHHDVKRLFLHQIPPTCATPRAVRTLERGYGGGGVATRVESRIHPQDRHDGPSCGPPDGAWFPATSPATLWVPIIGTVALSAPRPGRLGARA